MSMQGRSPTETDVEHELGPIRRWMHDIKGPLSVIRGHARLLALGRKGELSADQRRSIAAIERQVHRLERFIDDIETSEPPRTPEPEPREQPAGALARPRVLVADDDPEMIALLGDLLANRYELTFANDGKEALEAFGREAFHLAIIDLHLPRLDGFELVDALRAAALPWTPAFMFLSAQADPQTKVRALALGAVDYVTKPFDPDELAARIARVIAMVGREASLRADALTDPLTGLANYRSLALSLEREIERARRYGQPLSLITVDLDHLKTINDEHGHDAGDDSIRLVAQVLKGAVRSFEIVARQGGDEFAVLLPNTNHSEAARLAERLRVEVASHSVQGVRLSASIGVASRDKKHDLDAKSLVKASDDALYRAKYAGRDRVEVATP
jgi:two-component system chemotaxis response regulator CheY